MIIATQASPSKSRSVSSAKCSQVNQWDFLRIIRIKDSDEKMFFEPLKKLSLIFSFHSLLLACIRVALTAAFQFTDFNIAFDRCYALYLTGLFQHFILLKFSTQLDLFSLSTVWTIWSLNVKEPMMQYERTTCHSVKFHKIVLYYLSWCDWITAWKT